jgi:Uma2 family endonuclease
MSTVIPVPPQTGATLPAASATPLARADVVVQDKITIPGWILTLEDYRRWAESDEYPQHGWFSYLNGIIWIDPDMEEFLTHSRVKQAFNVMFGNFFSANTVGDFVPDRMFFANETVNLATEPDGLFYLWETMKSQRLRLVPAKRFAGYMQLEGTPDGVLEIISEGSVSKDVVYLRELYWKAQIPEYWVVDARKDSIDFDILRHAADGYQPSIVDQGWVRSEVLGHWFRIERKTDPLGLAQFVVHVREN